eukprot:scaffold11394_cov183-Amphora_coffeaeformis.AAC.14
MALPSLDLDDDNDKSSEQTRQEIDVENPNRRGNHNPEFPLCREKSFEGLLGSFMKGAAPKKAGLRRKEENETNAPPERRSVGRTKSFEGMLQPQPSFRGGRRPNPTRTEGVEDDNE